MGSCPCYGIKIAVAGVLLVANDFGVLGARLMNSPWLLVGIILIVLGALKAVWPCCPMHCKTASPMVKPKLARKR